jgi:hypothetical protein
VFCFVCKLDIVVGGSPCDSLRQEICLCFSGCVVMVRMLAGRHDAVVMCENVGISDFLGRIAKTVSLLVKWLLQQQMCSCLILSP